MKNFFIFIVLLYFCLPLHSFEENKKENFLNIVYQIEKTTSNYIDDRLFFEKAATDIKKLNLEANFFKNFSDKELTDSFHALFKLRYQENFSLEILENIYTEKLKRKILTSADKNLLFRTYLELREFDKLKKFLSENKDIKSPIL